LPIADFSSIEGVIIQASSGLYFSMKLRKDRDMVGFLYVMDFTSTGITWLNNNVIFEIIWLYASF